MSVQIEEGSKFKIKYMEICPFSSNEYEAETTATYLNGFYWFNDEDGQEKFRCKSSIIIIEETV